MIDKGFLLLLGTVEACSGEKKKMQTPEMLCFGVVTKLQAHQWKLKLHPHPRCSVSSRALQSWVYCELIRHCTCRYGMDQESILPFIHQSLTGGRRRVTGSMVGSHKFRTQAVSVHHTDLCTKLGAALIATPHTPSAASIFESRDDHGGESTVLKCI